MDKTPVTTRRHLPWDPGHVWGRLTGPEGFEKWMGPGSSIDPRPGGLLIAADVESGEPKIGQVLEVDPEERLLWAWRPLGSLGDVSEVEVELQPGSSQQDDEPSTEIVVTERPTTVPIPWSVGSAQACVGGGLATW